MQTLAYVTSSAQIVFMLKYYAMLETTDSNNNNEESVILHPVLISLVQSKGSFSHSEESPLFPTATSNSKIEKTQGMQTDPF